MERVYISSPYTHPEPEVREERYRKAMVATKAIMLKGYAAFSPVVHSHPLVSDDVLPNHHNFWMSQDLPWLEASSALVILPLPGWEDSKGMAMEIRLAESLKIPVYEFAKFLEAK